MLEEKVNIKDICKKVAFASESIAFQYVKKLQKTSFRDKVPQRVYLCEKCANWHLTSKPDYRDLKLNNYKEKIKELNKILKTRENLLDKMIMFNLFISFTLFIFLS